MDVDDVRAMAREDPSVMSPVERPTNTAGIRNAGLDLAIALIREAYVEDHLIGEILGMLEEAKG